MSQFNGGVYGGWYQGGGCTLLDWVDLLRDIEIHQFCATIRYLVNVAGRREAGESFTRKLAYLELIAKRLDELSALCDTTDLPLWLLCFGSYKL